MTCRVLIVDDHAIVREALAQWIASTDDLVVAGVAATAREAIARVRDAAFDVLILDLSLPDGGGLEVLPEVRLHAPDARVIVYSMYPERQYGPRLMRDGVAAYLSKDRSIRELLAAIRKVAAGGRYITDVVADNLLSPTGAWDDLSARELQVMQLLGQGRKTSEIAAQLHISASTVSTHFKRIRDKLGAESLTDLIRMAFRQGLVD